MTTITAELVKELRERTGAGMMECKKALTAANGDIEAAIDAMRKSGMAKAAKKAGRVAAEGIIVVRLSSDRKLGIIIEINCETDFVARDVNFKTFANAVADCALSTRIIDVDVLINQTLANSEQTIEQARHELVNKLGENIKIRRVGMIKAEGIVGEYVHSGRIGVLIGLANTDATMAKDLAMHIAASNPQAISPEEVGEDLITREREIFIAQSSTSGKSPEIIEKMVAGRINKFLAEVSLLGQPFVKDPSKTVSSLLTATKNKVTAFIRFEVGEGIEKQVEDFAEAVRAQVSGGA